MSAGESQSHGQIEAYQHSLDHVDSSWLLPLGVSDHDSVPTILSSRRGRRSLTRSFVAHHGLPSVPSEGLAQNHQWVLRGRIFLRTLASRLGLLASADLVRTSVSREAVSVLHRTLGAAACRQAAEACITPGAIQIDGLTRATFDGALQTGNIEPYLVRVGRCLLELALDEADDFARMRLRYAFEADSDRSADAKLSVDSTQLSDTIARLAGEL